MAEGTYKPNRRGPYRLFRYMTPEEIKLEAHHKHGSDVTQRMLKARDISLYKFLEKKELLDLFPVGKALKRELKKRSKEALIRYVRVCYPFIYTKQHLQKIDDALYQHLAKRKIVVGGVIPELKEYWDSRFAEEEVRLNSELGKAAA